MVATTKQLESIPVPDSTNEGLLRTVGALKTAVEQLIGTPSKGNLAPSRTFVQQTQPTAVSVGDVWINVSDLQTQGGTSGLFQSDGTIVSVWDGTQWRVVSAAGAFVEQFLTSSVNIGTGGANIVQVLTMGPLGGANQVWEIEAKANVWNTANAMVMTAYLVQGGQTMGSPPFAASQILVEDEVVTAAANWPLDMLMKKVVVLTGPTMFGLYGYNQSASGGIFSGAVLHALTTRAAATYLRAKRLL